MNKCSITFLSMISFLAVAPCYSDSFHDQASDPVYTDGWNHGDNGGKSELSFRAWSMDKMEDSICSVIDATTLGGSPLMNTDGLSWVLTSSRVDETNSTARLYRDTGITTPDGTIAEVDVQVLNHSGYSDLVFHGFMGPCVLLDSGIFTGGNWFLTDGSGTQDTGIHSSTPVRFKYIDGLVGRDYTLEISDLGDGSVLYTHKGISKSSTTVESIEILQTDTYKEAGLDTQFILNNLAFYTKVDQDKKVVFATE